MTEVDYEVKLVAGLLVAGATKQEVKDVVASFNKGLTQEAGINTPAQVALGRLMRFLYLKGKVKINTKWQDAPIDVKAAFGPLGAQ